MLPSSASPCEISDDVCCNVLYDTADWLLTNIFDQLCSCYGDDACNSKPIAYVTFGIGDDGIRDALTVAIVSASPSPQTVAGRGGVTVPFGLYRCLFEIRLRESGWPMAHTEGQAVVAPDPVLQNKLARHAFSHGEMMYRKVNSLYQRRLLTPPTFPQCANAIIGELVPLVPLGGVVGFTVQVAIDMPWTWGSG